MKLILCRNHEALNDADSALTGLATSDPVYLKCLALRGDALYQMGRFEHALMFYHRGKRLKDSDDFRLGIQKASDAINNALKNVRIKVSFRIF